MKKKFFLKNSYALLVLLIIILQVNLFSQVTIKEKVEIDPINYQSDNPPTQHTIVFNLQWDRPDVQASVAGVTIPCQSAGADWQYGGLLQETIFLLKR